MFAHEHVVHAGLIEDQEADVIEQLHKLLKRKVWGQEPDTLPRARVSKRLLFSLSTLAGIHFSG